MARLHIAFFPFMAKGHTIPLLHLAKLIHQHRPHATFTIFTTPANQPFISTTLSTLPPTVYTIVALPFSVSTIRGDNKRGEVETENHVIDNNATIPVGVESTDQLPSMSLFLSFIETTESIQPYFDTAIENLQNGKNPISFLICDWFLYWTHHATTKFNIPRLYFTGMSMYAATISGLVYMHNLFDVVECKDEEVQVPGFHGIRISKNDFDAALNGPEACEEAVEFTKKLGLACSKSQGYVVNSFEELELEFLSEFLGSKSWCVGPLCLAEKARADTHTLNNEPASLMNWLDQRKNEGKCVLYVAFGTQAEITNEQLREIGLGLEKSGVVFVWALKIKASQEEVMKGFEERVRGRGMVVRGWVEQRAILEHESVFGFLSHCGWNSVIESVCAGVSILACPMMADQHLNARLVVEVIKVGLRVETCDGSVRGFIKWEGLSKMVKELMEGELGKVVRKNVKDISVVAKKAVEEGGSSWSNLNTLLDEFEMARINY